MKTIIRINPHVVDSPERIAAEKLPMLAVRMLADSYSDRRIEFGDDALLLVDHAKDGIPVYMTLGTRAPELAVGGRRVWAVFDPPDSQEPVATFFEQAMAEAWAKAHAAAGKVGQIDATDRPVVRVAVAVLIMREGKILLGKLKRTGQYALPEGELLVGESVDSAVRRAAKVTAGLDVGTIGVSRAAPYVNTFIQKAGQHFLVLVMAAEYVGGEPQAIDPMWESCGWFDGEDPPRPLFVTVQQIFTLAQRNTAPPPAPLPTNPPSLVAASMAARQRAKAKKQAQAKAKQRTSARARR